MNEFDVVDGSEHRFLMRIAFCAGVCIAALIGATAAGIAWVHELLS